MLSVVRKGLLLPCVRSCGRRAMSSEAVIFKGVTASNIAEASFFIPEGSKVSLMGPNDAGYFL